jgi:hypothetical protein
VPIGRPAANARVYVLDEDLNSVPPGVVGEMYLAGDGLAIGYFNRPELTANAFVTAADPRGQNYAATIPHTRSGRERLYRTGDFARWTAMGRLEFLGRKDHQVKIGGFRIELEEIEARLLAHPDVRETVVEVTNSPAAIGSDESSEPAKPVVNLLIAYYISARTLTSAELRDHLAEQLPDYMVPTYFVRLDAWPLTTNGKVDRQALPEPSQQHALRPHDDVAPRTDLERALTAMWCQLLNVERIGINDEFFELGGYSLLAMRAVSRMRDLFGVDVPLEVMFAKPTIAAVANALIEAKANRQMRGPAPTIARQTRRASGTPAR